MDKIEVMKAIKEIEDYLIPFLKLDTYERSLYYYLFRHTRLIDKLETIFVISSSNKTVGLTEFATRNRLRSMDKKGCIKIIETRRAGLKVSVLLPSEIEGCVVDRKKQIEPINIETLDFFADPKYREAILDRENGECFYCLKKITKQNYALDHLVSQANGGDNSYRNIVATCCECNSLKQGRNGDDFVRNLYRNGKLTSKELEERLNTIESVKNGQIKPEI